MPSSVIPVRGLSVRLSVGEVSSVDDGFGEYVTLDCISRSITYDGGVAGEVDVSSFCSNAKETRFGLENSGTISVQGHWLQGHPAHAVIRAAALDKRKRLFEVTFVDGTTFKALAFVSQRSWAAAVDGVVSATFNFRLTGPVSESEVGSLQVSIARLQIVKYAPSVLGSSSGLAEVSTAQMQIAKYAPSVLDGSSGGEMLLESDGVLLTESGDFFVLE
jgi:hypothetical protein